MTIKKFLFIIVLTTLCISCSDQKFEMVNMRIDHYQDVAISLHPQLVYLVQIGDNIGSDNWNYLYYDFEGFEYEPGYRYNLSVRKIPVENPPADAPGIEYELREVISKVKVDKDTPFDITLKLGQRTFVTGDKQNGFKLLKSKTIICKELCNELSNALKSEQSESERRLTVTFHHAGQDTIKLVDL